MLCAGDKTPAFNYLDTGRSELTATKNDKLGGTRVCSVCERDFVSSRQRMKYCSDNCVDDARRKRVNLKNSQLSKFPMKKRCVFCKSTYMAKTSKAMYCSNSCQQKALYKKKVYKKLCATCSAVTETNKRTRKYCSYECQYIASRMRESMGPHLPKKTRARRVYDKNKECLCLCCGKTFMAKFNNAKFCEKKCHYVYTFEKNKEYRRSHSLRNPEMVRAWRLNRKRGYRSISERDLKRMLVRHKNRCSYCSVELSPAWPITPSSLQWDHIIPISLDGTTTIGNMTPSCFSCNQSKKAKLPIVFKIELKKKGYSK